MSMPNTIPFIFFCLWLSSPDDQITKYSPADFCSLPFLNAFRVHRYDEPYF